MYVQSSLIFLVDEQSEVADSAAAERDLVERWIGLITKKSDIKQDRLVIKTHAGEFSNFSRGCNSCSFWKGM